MLAGLKVSRDLYRQIVEHLAAAMPNEGVGLIGTVSDGDYRQAVAFFPGSNIDQSPNRYTMDPAEVMSAFREMGANGWHLGAIAHSHIASPPTPSETDLREAYYPEALQLIVSFREQHGEAKLWRIPELGSTQKPVEADLAIDNAGPGDGVPVDEQGASMRVTSTSTRSQPNRLDD